MLESLAPLGVLALLGATIYAVLRGVPWMPGWRDLVSRYPAPPDFAGRRWWFRSGTVGRLQYQATLLVGADPRGLLLGIHLLFLVAPARVYVPWEAVRATPLDGLFVTRVRLEVEGCPDATISISTRLARRLAEASGGRFVVPV